MPKFVAIGVLLALTALPAAAEHVFGLPIHSPPGRVAPAVTLADASPAGAGEITLNQLAEVSDFAPETILVADTDHDGRLELVFTGGVSVTFRIWERITESVYALADTGESNFHVFAAGDLDGDGLADLVGQYSGYVQVFESATAESHPSVLVWSSEYLSNISGESAIGDTDGDGRMEIIHSVNGPGRLVIFECTGDNTYQQVFDGAIQGTAETGEKVLWDFDGDGRMEIALCGSPGYLNIFESTGDNAWVRTAALWTGMSNAYSVDGGKDTDGNGVPEIFVQGNLFTQGTAFFCVAVYEPVADNVFSQMAFLNTGDMGIGWSPNEIADIDADGSLEYVMLGSVPGLRVFRATGPGSWSLAGTVHGPGGGVVAYDMNGNGRPELIWPYWTVRVFEHPSTVTEAPVAERLPLRISPNPCSASGRLRIELAGASNPGGPGGASSGAPAARIVVVDPRGRIVHRAITSSGGTATWQPAGISAGVYFVRAEPGRGQPPAVRKLTIRP